jgi:mxaJ protein
MSMRFLNALPASALCIALTACHAPAPPQPPLEATGPVLRVCADPNNLPFSNATGAGFENKIAEIVARDLGARLEYVWWAQRRGFIRNTVRAGMCDVVIGVPVDLEMTATTRPYYRSGYVFVTRAGDPAPASLDDPWLKQAIVGVHLIGDDSSNSPPAHALSARGVIANVRGFSIYGNYAEPDPPARLIRAVSDNTIDVAVAWGPLAGYFARESSTPLHVSPVKPREEPPYRFEFDIAMGVARSNRELLARLNDVLDRERDRIDTLLREYGVPFTHADVAMVSR